MSNRIDNPTVLFNDPRRNVPEAVRDGLLETLGLTLNVRHRDRKQAKFGISTSEDALTWTIFKYLHDSGRLASVLRRVGLPIPDRVSRPEALLLWGAPVPSEKALNERGWKLRGRLEEIANRLRENPTLRTEPDVKIDFGADGDITLEVKHRTGTDMKNEGHREWDRYYPPNSPFPYAEAMQGSRCFGLARNWRFGLELTADPPRSFTLVCLGPADLFRDKREQKIIRSFEECLPKGGPARFRTLTWEALLGAVDHAPDWFVEFFASRGYPYVGRTDEAG